MSETPLVPPIVAAYLEQFDTVAGRLPIGRRRRLRSEIVDHLLELVPNHLGDEDARLALIEFGTPEEILAQETRAEQEPKSRRLLVAGIAVTAAVLAGGVALFVSQVAGPEQSEVPASSAAATAQIVTSLPSGEDRVTEGPAFQEYASIIADLPALPEGAEWPSGVPAGTVVGVVPDGSGVMEAGLGQNIANYTYVCAWEFEYLTAASKGDDDRMDAAYLALSAWSTDDFWAGSDPSRIWAAHTLGPLLDGNVNNLRLDVPTMCFNAGIPVQYYALVEQGL